MQNPLIYSTDDVMGMLDGLLADRGGAWWSDFFSDRAKPCPFFVDLPDENLPAWFDEGRLGAGRVLELGSGQGRNAVFLVGRGCRVEAVDFSAEAIGWARERVAAAGVAVDFQECSIFDATFEEGAYDLVYDSGCFHHLAPHRRRDYVELVSRALKPGGAFGLVCFSAEAGSGLTDEQVYEQRTLGGGLGYSQDRLRTLWDREPFRVDVLRPMLAKGEQDASFGQDFLWVLLAVKNPGSARSIRQRVR